MSQPQQDMLRNAQDWMGSLQAKAWHATVGTYFSDKQLGLDRDPFRRAWPGGGIA